jgi:KRAB domain-containing zinc finger protein
MTIDQDKTNINDQDEVVESESKKQKEDDVSSTPQSQEESFVNSLFNEDFFNQDDPEVGDILPDPEQLEQGIAQDYNQFVEKRGKKFICTFEDCIRNFAKRKDCEEHVITTHFNKPFICTKCNKTYHSSKRYKIHEQKCTGKSEKTEKELYYKQFIKKKNKKSICAFQDCGQEFADIRTCKEHIQVHHLNQPYICKKCNKKYYSSKAHKSHEEECNPEKIKKELYKQFIEKKDGRFICTFNNCEQEFAKAIDCKEHIRIHHFNQPYICKKCNKKFHSSKNYKPHKKQCTGKSIQKLFYNDLLKKFICNQCDKPYPTLSALKKHAFNAHGKIKCCDILFQKDEFSNHLKAMHLGYTNECQFCKNLFANNITLRKHIRKLHPGEKLN